MSELRIHLKFGEYEIELEGSADVVERQFEPFRQLLIPAPALAPLETPLTQSGEGAQNPTRMQLEKIVQGRGTIYSLSVKAKLEDAILVILLAQRTFRRNETVSGIEIMSGLRDSGFGVRRVDSILNRFSRQARVVATGQRRRRRYRLSLDGLQQAQQIARTLIAQLPSSES